MTDTSIALNFQMPVACITCYGRSGSVLLHGLLDNHPQIIAAPSHTLVDLQEFLMTADYTDVPALVGEIVEKFGLLFSETDQTPYLRAAATTKIGVARKAFRHNLLQILLSEAQSMGSTHTHPAVVLRAIHFAYHAALGRNINDAKIIVWQKHTPFSAAQPRAWLLENIQNMRFLVPVRRPEVTFSAHYAAKSDPAFPSGKREPWMLLEQLRQSGSIDADAAPVSGAIRFEDMHAETEKVTRAIAAFLEIDWHPNMLEPTVDGKELLFPKGNGVIRGFNPDVGKTQRAPHLSWFDKLHLEVVNHAVYRHWGYETTARSKVQRAAIAFLGVFIPMKMNLIELGRDLKLLLRSPRAAITRIKDRHINTYQALKFLRAFNDGKTPTKILNRLY